MATVIEEARHRSVAPADDIELRTLEDPTQTPIPSVSAIDEAYGLTRATVLKIVAAGFSFFFAGVNDGSLGALTPYILRTYHVGTEYVALIYASTFLGWVLAACTNSHIARYFGLGSILTLGAVIQLASHLLRFWGPPFGLYVVTFFLSALGCAYQDSHSNTFVTSVKGAHRWLGFIHAMWALGCLVSPFVATAIASKVQDRWTLFYLFPMGIGVFNVAGVLVAFRDSLTIQPRASTEAENSSRSKTASRDIIETLKSPPVYLLSLFYFFMLGVGITAGGWVVEYLVSARNGKLPDVGYVSAGLWGGVFLGRVLLAEPTHRYGERKMAMSYCVLILALQLVFWLVPNLISSAVTICALGFFIGPLFATGMSIGSKLFDKRIQPTALGFIFVLAQAGGALFPALTGVVASKAGVKVMQPMLVGLIVAMAIAWALVPKVPRRDN
ncbi:major facilitator superfamily domain-containing protein [Lophiotrema nucula]|uniref:Major facilitator superfamily domain-containing protein n=1 Tax=Lophiotrema nucula TaxID=690887 RepID=A0A6A5YIE3_9PLEO|nr:major facilitator superfamily domain-containing protein [Lophiotrema nucula]